MAKVAAKERTEDGPDATELTVALAGRYEILPRKPLPALASPTAPAFAVRDAREPSRRLFALLCSKELPFREETLTALRRLKRPQLLPPLEWGVVDWPAEDPSKNSAGDPGPGRRPAVIFEAPGGGRLMPSLSATISPIDDERLTRYVIRPALTGLKELAVMGLSHGAIRPDNMFYRNGAPGDVVLGEGCSAPPGFAQPALFVTIEGGMCSPGGRGPGSFADDLYALGVTLLLLLLGRNPLQDHDDHAVVAAKIAHGSYAAIAGQAGFSTTMTEVLRGLLSDNPEHRWTFDQFDAWLDGRRLSPNPPSLPPRAGRPFTFDEVEYWTRPALGHAMARSWDRAVGVAQSGLLESWLRRSLGDRDRADFMASTAAALIQESGGSERASHGLVGCSLIALDPAAPVRYRELATRVDSLGPALAAGFDRPGFVQTFVEMIEHKLPQIWIQLQDESRSDFFAVGKILDMVRYFLDRTGPGFSVERCLYELNPGLPCRSPLLEEECVSKLGDLLPALDRLAARVSHDREPVDRHIAAFIASRTKHLTDRDFESLRPNVEPHRRRLGMLRLLASVEQVSGRAEAEAASLRAWLAAFAEPIVESYHHRPYQKALRREIARATEGGEIADLVRLLDDEEMRRRDSDGFDRARTRYAAAQREVSWLEANGMMAPDRVTGLATRAAAVTSGVTAGVVLFGIVMALAL